MGLPLLGAGASSGGGGGAAPVDDAVAFWPLDSTNAGNDVSGNARHLTWTGTPAYAAGPDATANAAADLTGPPYLSRATPVLTAGPFSLTLWYKSSSTSGFDLVWQGDGSFVSQGVYADDNPFLLARGTHAGSFAEVPLPAAGAWHHAVVTFEAGEQVLYVDGDMEDLAAGVAGPDYSNSDLVAVGKGAEWSGLSGSICLVGWYDYALSPAQVLTLYGGGAGHNPYPPAAGMTGLDFSLPANSGYLSLVRV